jgi:Undecaprenyl pyrophosphate synthase
MKKEKSNDFKRIPKHIGIIPDGNRRWALKKKLQKHDGYHHGIKPGFLLYEQLIQYGVKEATFYGFTKDNTKRPTLQTDAYVNACIAAVKLLENRDANLLVIGNTKSKFFPDALRKYANKRVMFGKGLININFLINYDWNWDLSAAQNNDVFSKDFIKNIASKDIPKMDLIIRWGGHTRLSGFLPVQSVYSDFYVLKKYWPDFDKTDLLEALNWYQNCDVTLGG